jgi:UDP-N-acetylglucosamine 2-epimerase (non-hydrolysing)
MSRHVVVFSSTRADLWPLSPVIEALHADDRFSLTLLATGAHNADDIERYRAATGLSSSEVRFVPAMPDDDVADAFAGAIAEVTTIVSSVLASAGPDVLLVLGDRYELLGALAAALVHRVPVAHLHGGEITAGAIDDLVRHAATKLSHLHLCAAEPYARRVRQLGEEDARVHVVGAPSLDRLVEGASPVAIEELRRTVEADWNRPVALLTYHPPTGDPRALEGELDALLVGLHEVPTVIATHPGADPGSQEVLRRIRTWAGRRSGVVIVPSLGPLYPAALRTVDVVVGNSSSGIVEAPTFGTPVVNIGRRQQGRLRAPTIEDVEATPGAVELAVRRALEAGRAPEPQNPYGDGRSAPRIMKLLAEVDLGWLVDKAFVDR